MNIDDLRDNIFPPQDQEKLTVTVRGEQRKCVGCGAVVHYRRFMLSCGSRTKDYVASSGGDGIGVFCTTALCSDCLTRLEADLGG